MKHIPNLLTVLRLVLSVAMFAAFVWFAAGAPERYAEPLIYFILFAFVVAAVTDFFDGWLARRWQVVSVVGAILDPIADKILVCGALLGLIAIRAPYALLFGGIILFREFSVSALREVLAPRGIKLPVTFLAKIKTTLQLVAIAAMLIIWFWPAWHIDARMDHLRMALEGAISLMAVATLITLWTGIEYGHQAWLALRGRG